MLVLHVLWVELRNRHLANLVAITTAHLHTPITSCTYRIKGCNSVAMETDTWTYLCFDTPKIIRNLLTLPDFLELCPVPLILQWVRASFAMSETNFCAARDTRRTLYCVCWVIHSLHSNHSQYISHWDYMRSSNIAHVHLTCVVYWV